VRDGHYFFFFFDRTALQASRPSGDDIATSTSTSIEPPCGPTPSPDDLPRPTRRGDLCRGGIHPLVPTPLPTLSSATSHDPRGAATYAAAASSRVSRPPRPRPPRRPTPRRHLAACPDSFAHAPPDNAPRRAHPVDAPLPPPSRSLTAPLPTAARTQNSGSRVSSQIDATLLRPQGLAVTTRPLLLLLRSHSLAGFRPSGDDTATTTSSSIALPCRLPGPAVTTRPLLLLLRSHCLASFQAQR